MKQSTSCHCQWVITLCYLHVAQQEKHLRISTVLPRVGLFGTLIPQASRSFARLLKDIALLHHFPTKLYDLIPKHFCATFTASPQWHFVVIFPRFATELSPKCLSTQLLQSSATSQQHSPPQFSHTIFTSHCTHATLFPAPCFNILIFWLGWTLSNNEPNALTAVL